MVPARDAGEEIPRDDETGKIQSVIRTLDKDERLFIKDLPIASSLPPVDAQSLIKNGWVAHVGKWCVLTPRGGNVAVTRNLTKEVQNWFTILAHVPKRSALAHLEQEGVIENRQGFPLLTPFGEVIKEQLHLIEEYITHNSWRLPAESSDKESRNQI